jgi:hypothetical protein
MSRATWRSIVAVVILVIGPLLAIADEPPSLGQPITDPAEITNRMAGNTLSGIVMETGTPWAEFYCDTGRSLYEFGNIARGKWWTEDGKVCFAYEYDDYKRPICFKMFGKTDGSLSFVGRDDAGQPTTFLSRPPVRGDPLHLEERAVHGCALEPSV